MNSTGTSYAATSNATGYEWKNRKNSEAVAAATADASIGYAVQHPTEFLFYSGSPYDWLNVSANWDQRDNLWGNPNTAGTRPNASQGSKSIYDPCPPGWRVAPQDTWTAFAKNGTGGSSQQNVYPDTFSAGYSFYYDANDASSGKTAFFPAAGLRYGSSGELANTSSYGYYWSSSPGYGGSNSATTIAPTASACVASKESSERALARRAYSIDSIIWPERSSAPAFFTAEGGNFFLIFFTVWEKNIFAGKSLGKFNKIEKNSTFTL